MPKNSTETPPLRKKFVLFLSLIANEHRVGLSGNWSVPVYWVIMCEGLLPREGLKHQELGPTLKTPNLKCFGWATFRTRVRAARARFLLLDRAKWGALTQAHTLIFLHI
jgi:hypothetical protein